MCASVTPSNNLKLNDSGAAYFTTMNESPDTVSSAQHNSSSKSSTFSEVMYSRTRKISFSSSSDSSDDANVISSQLGHHNIIPCNDSSKLTERQLLQEKIKQLESLNSTLIDKVVELSSQIPQCNKSEHAIKSFSVPNFFHRIHIYSDSMGRDIADQLRKMLPESCSLYSSLKPGALFRDVIKSIPKLCHDFTHRDVIIIMGGTNDMPSLSVSATTNTYGLCSKYFNLSKLNNLFIKTNIIVHNIPYRYDNFSYISTNIYETNKNLEYKSYKNNFHLLKSNANINRSHFTKHEM